MAEGLLVNRLVQSSGGSSTQGEFEVRFIDIDGTILKTEYVDSGGSATPPSNPNYDSTYLTFVEWNNSYTNIQHDMDIGATYETTDGKTYLFVFTTEAVGYTLTLRLNKTDTSSLTISWGDGTTDYTTSASGDITPSHTYTTEGEFVISIGITSGTGKYKLGQGATSTAFVSEYTLATALYIGEDALLNDYSLYQHRQLHIVVIPNTISGTLNKQALSYLDAIRTIILPDTITDEDSYGYSFISCGSASAIILPNTWVGSIVRSSSFDNCFNLLKIVLPDSITIISNNAFSDCYNIKKAVSVNAYSFANYCFQECSTLEEVITNYTGEYLLFGESSFKYCYRFIGFDYPMIFNFDEPFYECYNLKYAHILRNTVKESAFRSCYSLREIIMDEGVTRVDKYAFWYLKSIEEITFPSTITYFEGYTINQNYDKMDVTILATTPPTLASATFIVGCPATTRIFVPSASLAAYKAATNWSTYADQIYAIPT